MEDREIANIIGKKIKLIEKIKGRTKEFFENKSNLCCQSIKVICTWYFHNSIGKRMIKNIPKL